MDSQETCKKLSVLDQFFSFLQKKYVYRTSSIKRYYLQLYLGDVTGGFGFIRSSIQVRSHSMNFQSKKWLHFWRYLRVYKGDSEEEEGRNSQSCE